MGIIRTALELRNPVDKGLESISVLALVDTGALHLCLPGHVVLQLGLSELERRDVTLADGRRVLVPYVGPVEVNPLNPNIPGSLAK